MPGLQNIIPEVKEWVAAPVTSRMSILDVALTTILVVSVAFLWTRALALITDS